MGQQRRSRLAYDGCSLGGSGAPGRGISALRRRLGGCRFRGKGFASFRPHVAVPIVVLLAAAARKLVERSRGAAHNIAPFVAWCAFSPPPLQSGSAMSQPLIGRLAHAVDMVAAQPKFERGRRQTRGLTSGVATAAAAVAAVNPPAARIADLLKALKIDVSFLTPQHALQRHEGACGEPPEVEIVQSGDAGVFAAWGTLRVAESAQSVFERLTDPEENLRIFSRTAASLNYRKLVAEDKAAGTRLFEVSKSGRWKLLGLPFTFESTVLALEDWSALEIRFQLKKPGAMKHLSGFWRIVPSGPRESVVLFYNEAEPSMPIPSLFRVFAGRFIQEMASSLLQDLRLAAATWHSNSSSEVASNPVADEGAM